MKILFMKRFLLLIAPVLLILLAFRPVTAITVTGTVTDEKGTPVTGVTVLVKGTRNATSSGTDGTYRILVAGTGDILVFSASGFQSREEKVAGRTKIDVSLLPASQVMSEVVVTAYGQQRKKDMTRAVAGVPLPPSGTQFYAGYALQGKVAGVQIQGLNGNGYQPGYQQGYFDREGYDKITENGFLKATDNPLSTFSIDVDAASYSNVRRFLNTGQLPPAGAVRIEEMINYFKYEYPQPENKDPFSINTEISEAPWNKDHKLVLIGLQGKKIPVENLPASNLVFLIDVSGSMQGPERIGLVKASMKMLVEQLREQDKVAIVVYAGAAGLVLPSTSGSDKQKIREAIDDLEAGGSTAGGAGIKLAYKTAKEYFVKGGNNRVILCTDGDFNVGESSDDAMERLIEEERKSGVFLTVLGYGMGNYQDAKMQKLADKGNGNHAYIDGITEAKKVLVNEFGGTLFTIAKDVKLQIEFNPAKVQAYRLIGYENRMLAKEDFNDDKKDAGELGSGHTVTALYEVIPVGVKSSFLPSVDPLKYQQRNEKASKQSETDEIMTVKFRYKTPDADVSRLIEHPLRDKSVAVAGTSDNFRFAAAVAQFGMLLRNSEFKSNASFESVLSLAKKSMAADADGYRSEFVRLVESARLLSKGKKPVTDFEEEEETLPLGPNK
ncbi:MAG: von Willebrand factor type A domain-containing protein [Sphingobacteriales bacterium]|nr:von Willebrand factor type A domain-containing protein [Sphingobacteriales bacterium]